MVKFGTFLSFIALAIGNLAFSQDIHFSQFEAAPLILNPAQTGAYDGDWQFGSNYRTQWSAVGRPYETMAASFDHKLWLLPGDLSVGMLFTGDQSGNVQLKSNQILATAGYHHYSGKHVIGIGIQAGIIMKSYNTDITFPEQYSRDEGGYTTELPNGETELGDRLSHGDVNIGLLYRTKLKDKDFEFGYSIQHASAPKSSFFGRAVDLPPRQNIQVGLHIPINDQFFVKPIIWYSRTNKAAELLPAVTGGMNLAPNNLNAKTAMIQFSFRDGFNRNSDAVVSTFAMDFAQIRAGISYDVNVSGFTEATGGRGALELSLIYRGLSSKIQKIVIPCDRF